LVAQTTLIVFSQRAAS